MAYIVVIAIITLPFWFPVLFVLTRSLPQLGRRGGFRLDKEFPESPGSAVQSVKTRRSR